jgi:hypothetical protein
VAYSATSDRYLTVWSGEEATTQEVEIFGRFMEGNGMLGPITRLTHQGTDGDESWAARAPALVWNSTDDHFLLAWQGDADAEPGRVEIHLLRIHAATMSPIEDAVQVTSSGSDATRDAFAPDLAYNPTAPTPTYGLVYHSDQGVDNDYRILYREIRPDFTFFPSSNPVSTGPLGRDALEPSIAWNDNAQEFLVVWHGDPDATDDENEIYGQLLAETGADIGDNFRISDVGSDGDADYDATFADVAYDATLDEWLVVWHGDDDANGGLNDDNEIYGQRLTATGTAVGTNDFKISTMGAPGMDFGASNARVESRGGGFGVVWTGSHDTGDLVSGEFEIWGQAIGATALVGPMERLSITGPDGSFTRDAYAPAPVYDGTEFYVVWSADGQPLAQTEFEIFGRSVALDGN